MYKYFWVILLIPFEALSSTWNSQLNWFNRYINQSPVNSIYNPDNQALKIPDHTLESDLRPTISWSNDSHKIKFDPRLILRLTESDYHDEEHTTDKTEIFINELNYQGNFGDHQFTLGVQNYQWGPAEMLSPTNPIFRFRNDQRSLFFQQRGRNLVRWNWQIDEKWNFISMIEVSKSAQEFSKEDQKFKGNGLLKIERALDKASDYIGLVAGVTPYAEDFFGEYFAYNLTQEFSIYLDARHQFGSNNFYPSSDPFSLHLEKRDHKFHTLANLGLRHESRVDVRLEYIFNGVGLDSGEWDDASNSLQALGPNSRENFKRYFRSGRDDLQRRHYGYASVRVPDLGESEEYTVFLRHFHSLEDNSGSSQFQVDRITGENFNLYLEMSYFAGRKESEFGSLLRREISLGLRLSI